MPISKWNLWSQICNPKSYYIKGCLWSKIQDIKVCILTIIEVMLLLEKINDHSVYNYDSK